MGSNSSSGGGGGGGGNQQAKARRLMTTVPSYGKPKTKSVTTGTLSDPREKNDTAAKMDLFINDPYTKKQGGPLMLRPFEPLFDAGAKKTRTFFTDKVLTSKRAKKNIGYSKEEFSKLSRSKQESIYKDYLSKRSSNTTDAYGNKLNINSGPDNNNQVVQAPLVATTMPVKGSTEAEVSQVAPEVTAEEARAKANDLIAKKRKGRGRSMLIATSPQGVTNKNLTLSNKTLLGI